MQTKNSPHDGGQQDYSNHCGTHSTTPPTEPPDFEQAARFLTLLDETAESWTFQTFDDNKARKDPALARVLHGTFEEHWQELCRLSALGAGIFITVNETNGKGRKVADIIRVRAVFQECDRPGTPEPPLQPHIVVESSPGKYHRYLLVDGGYRFDLFGQVMARLVQDFGSDPNAKDSARVLRLPGFSHQKDPANPWIVRIIHESGEQPYLWDRVTAAIPPLVIEKKSADVPPGKGIEDPAKVRSALAALDPDIEYTPWLSVGMALHHATAGGAEGLALWDEWSARGNSYRPGETPYKWASFGAVNGRPVTLGSVFKMAAANGWRWKDPPKGDATDTEPPDLEPPPVDAYEDAKPHQEKAAEGDKPAHSIREQFGIKTLDEILKTQYPAPKWAIPGILPEGLTLLAGPPKVKKSWFSLGVSIAVALGGMALGKIPVEQGRVLYLALEDRERRLQARSRLILQNDQNGPQLLDIATRWKRLDNGGLEALRQYLTQHSDTRLMIIDTLAKVRPRKLKGQSDYDADYSAIDMLKALADEFAVSILVVTHTRKMEAEDFMDEIMGTHGVSGAADGGLVLKRPRCSDKAVLKITGRDIEDEREVVLEWHRPTCTWHLTDVNAAEVKLTPERHRVVEILRASPTPLSSKQIAAAIHGRDVGTKELGGRDDPGWKSTRWLLGEMLRKGTIEQLDNKSYCLPAAPAPEDNDGDDFEKDEKSTSTTSTISTTSTTSTTSTRPPSEPGAGGASGASFDAVAPSTDVSDCEEKEFSGGASGASGASGATVNSPEGDAATVTPAQPAAQPPEPPAAVTTITVEEMFRMMVAHTIEDTTGCATTAAEVDSVMAKIMPDDELLTAERVDGPQPAADEPVAPPPTPEPPPADPPARPTTPVSADGVTLLQWLRDNKKSGWESFRWLAPTLEWTPTRLEIAAMELARHRLAECANGAVQVQ